ncbi:MAG: helix-turn-helix domain-containing protein [Planctomycetaceae bacterium]|jgi:excisionase family DNA binding protein|nr:helix-turn-helix domain-containing protein [Planctomycetaceae bacterium]
MSSALPELMTVKEAADYLKVTPQYVRILCQEKVLEYIRVGTEYRIFRNQLLNSLQKAFSANTETAAK